MIDAIFLENFQSHKETVLELSPSVNIIIGQSDSGKSAILRAVNWIVNNKPAGDSFRRHGAEKTSVSISVNKANVITREKGKKLNSYYMDASGEYKAFGQDVPEDIQRVLNFSSLNMQYQMDSPFLLSESAGEVARTFNRIVDLEVIDQSVKEAAKKLDYCKKAIQYNLEESETIKEELESFHWLPAAEYDFELLEEIYLTFIETEKEYSNLSRLIQMYQDIKEEEIDVNISAAEKELKEMSASMIKIKSMDAVIEELSDLLANLDQTVLQHERITKQYNAMQKELQKIMPEICPLCGGKITWKK